MIFRFHPGVAEKKKNEGTGMALAGAASCRKILALVGWLWGPQQGMVCSSTHGVCTGSLVWRKENQALRADM